MRGRRRRVFFHLVSDGGGVGGALLLEQAAETVEVLAARQAQQLLGQYLLRLRVALVRRAATLHMNMNDTTSYQHLVVVT